MKKPARGLAFVEEPFTAEEGSIADPLLSMTSLFHSFEPRNQAQVEAAKLFKSKKVLFLIGPAGTGKTFCAVALALAHTLAQFQTKKMRAGRAGDCFPAPSFSKPPIVVTRPIIEAANEKLGFLPGELDNKIAPYLAPVYEILDSLQQEHPPSRTGKGTKKPGGLVVSAGGGGSNSSLRSLFKPLPLAYMRGHTIDGVALLEEAQNCNLKQLLCFITRLGKGAKAIITADPDQNDVAPFKNGQVSRKLSEEIPLLYFLNKMKQLDDVAVVQTTPADTLRDPFVAQVLDLFQLTSLE